MSQPRQRRPVWVPVLVYAVLMPTMLWLGFWQLGKWESQGNQLAEYEARGSQSLGAADIVDPATQQFERVVVTGQYVADRQILIDNIVRNGRNGFYVVTPFELDSGQHILVNRGWIPQSPRREPIGDITTSAATRTLSGRVGRLPVGGLRLGSATPDDVQWPLVMQFPSFDDIEAVTGFSLAGWTLLADASTDSIFERQWQPGGLPPERHLGYAVQWFAMATALTVIAVLVGWRSRRKKAP